MPHALWIGVAAAAGALATTVAGRSAQGSSVPGRHAAAPGSGDGGGRSGEALGRGGGGGGGGGHGGGGGGGGHGGAGRGGGWGGGGGLGPVQGRPMGGGFGRHGRFPTTFLFGDGGDFWWGWPYYYPPAPNPQYSCQWEETPPKEDTKMVCTPVPGAYPVVNAPVAWGPPGWAWW